MPIPTPPPPGPGTPGSQGGVPLNGAGYFTYEIERKTFSDGAVAEVRVQVAIFRDATGCWRKFRLVEAANTDCGCTPQRGLEEVFQCSSEECNRIVCRFHSKTCSSCSLVFCRSCVASHEVEGFSVILCGNCEADMKRSWIEKLARKVFWREE